MIHEPRVVPTGTADRRVMTAGEYLALDRESEQRYMFCAGEVFTMTGASRRHNWIVHNISRLIGNALVVD